MFRNGQVITIGLSCSTSQDIRGSMDSKRVNVLIAVGFMDMFLGVRRG